MDGPLVVFSVTGAKARSSVNGCEIWVGGSNFCEAWICAVATGGSEVEGGTASVVFFRGVEAVVSREDWGVIPAVEAG